MNKKMDNSNIISLNNAWLYVFYNSSMPNYFKINLGYKESLLEELDIINKLKELPNSFKIVTAKKIINPKEKLKSLYKIIDKYRVNKKMIYLE